MVVSSVSQLPVMCVCGSMDIIIIDVTIGGETEQYYQCQDCFNEWAVEDNLSSSEGAETE